MIQRIIVSLIRKAIFLAIGLGVILLIGYCNTDHKDYPGKAQFEKIDALIDRRSSDIAHGDSEETKAAATAFASLMKNMQAVLFKGGSGRSIATGGEFLTYVKRTPTAVVILCHVPELRNYKEGKTRDALGQIAWTAGKSAAQKIPGVRETDTLIIGLRGFASYGPVWEGPISGDVTKKTDDPDEKR